MARRNWLAGLAEKRGEAAARAPVRAGRDLPPPSLTPLSPPPLPRSPEPLSDDALIFARKAAAKLSESTAPAEGLRLSIAQGADLRGMIERIRASRKRHETLDQAGQARARLVEQLRAGRAGPALVLVGGTDSPAGAPRADSDAELEQAMQHALASALDTLRKLSTLPKGVA